MATDVLFNFYEILVNSLFGNIFLAIIGVGLVISLILFLTKTSTIFFMYWMFFYFLVMFTLYFGALGIVFAFLLVTSMLVYNIIKIFGREG